MTINKQAGWGVLPVAGPPTPGLGTRVTKGLKRVAKARVPLKRLNTAITDLAGKLGDATVNLAVAIDPNPAFKALTAAFDATGALAGKLASIDATLAKMGSPGGTLPVPSQAAFLIAWTLNGVRDALCDQQGASQASTNKQLRTQAGTARVKALAKWLYERYPQLASRFDAQFRDLSSGASGFEIERRTRLAELAGFEWQVLATVTDSVPPTVPTAARTRGAAKS